VLRSSRRSPRRCRRDPRDRDGERASMIAKGNTHMNGVRLANYMKTGKDGERAELWQLRGFEATNIVDAFRDVQIMAGATKCEHPFFHVQVRNRDGETLNRQQWEYAADRIERMLGLTDQPRAIAFHVDEKTGHEHMHVAWSRIDEATLKAKELPYFKFRLKKISRELEAHFGLEAVTNRREGNIKYAPTRAEDEQARRLGLDVHELRNTIRACYERSDCGASFQAALAHEGMRLAQGEKRDFIVIDREGGMHALGKRILDDTAAKIRARLSDLSRDNLPTVEQARILILEKGLQEEKKQVAREKTAPSWDRERDDRQWQDAVVNAAIEQEKAEQRFAEPAPRQGWAGSRKEKEVWPVSPPAQEAVKTSPRYHFEDAARQATDDRTPPATKLRGLSWKLDKLLERSDNGKAFAAALEDKGIAFARVTKDEADRSHRQAEFAKAIGNNAPRYRESEIVAVTEPRLEYRRMGEIVVPPRVHKLDQQAAEKFVAALGKKMQIEGIDGTMAKLDQSARQRSEHRTAARMENASTIRGRAIRYTKDGVGKGVKLGGGALRSFGKALDAASDAFSSLFSPTLTPQQKREGERDARRREAEAEDVIDFTRFTAELARQRQQEEEREETRQHERGGRER
jgi:hypothetical protein